MMHLSYERDRPLDPDVARDVIARLSRHIEEGAPPLARLAQMKSRELLEEFGGVLMNRIHHAEQ